MYAQALGAQRWFFVGQPLDSCQVKLDAASAAFKRARAVNQLNGAMFVQRAIALLRGTAADRQLLRQESEGAFTGRLLESRNAQWLFMHGHALCIANLVLGDIGSAERWLAFAGEYEKTGGNIHYSLVDHVLCDLLLAARRAAVAGESERPALLERIAKDAARLQNWAEQSPANFAHKSKLAAAEMARTRGEPMHVIVALYGEALLAAGEGFVHWRAFINERLADYWASVGQERIARLFLDEAYFLYQRWGASTKLQQLRQTHARIFEVLEVASTGHRGTVVRNQLTGVVPEGSLDIESMIKATRTISGEVKRDNLFAKLMATIIENAGAQRGSLILKSETGDELCVEATAHVDGESRGTGSQPIGECRELSEDIVRYVARTANTVVLDDAMHDPRYSRDPHVARGAVKSVLCVPVLHGGKLLAILYAENNAATHAFTSERIRLLEVIAAQAAISITNARLYDNLEAKVAERTRELLEKSQEVAAMLNSMQQGVFTVDEGLQIRPAYSAHLEFILGTNQIAGADCIELLFRGSNLGQDTVAAMRSALKFCFGAQVFAAELNFSHLVKAFERRTPSGERQDLEVDWNPIADDAGEIRKMLLVVRDVTSLKQLHATAAKNARELDIVGQIVEAGAAPFRLFREASQAALGALRSLLRDQTGPWNGDKLDAMLQNLHTLKGNARSLGLTHLTECIHLTEERYIELRATPELRPDPGALAADIESVSAALAEYEEVRQRKLGESWRAEDAGQSKTLDAIAAILRETTDGAVDPSQALARVEAALRRAKLVPLREVVEDVGRMLPSLSLELGKPAPALECIGAPVEVTSRWVGVLRDVLVHAFRNALDHGIDPVLERKALGKSAAGRVTVQAEQADERVIVRVRDDGCGLRLEALRERAGETTHDEALADRIFLGGVSTAGRASRVSGRAVGLNAVRALMRARGGDARIAFTDVARDGRRAFELVLEFPADASIPEGRASLPPPAFAAE